MKKSKKHIKVRDLKPTKDAKGGGKGITGGALTGATTGATTGAITGAPVN